MLELSKVQMKFRSTFSACKIHCGAPGIFPVHIVRWKKPRVSQLPAFLISFVHFFSCRLSFSSWFATSSAVLHSHGHTVFQGWWTQAWPAWWPGSEILYPSTPCWVSTAAAQRSPPSNSALMSTGASGPSHKTNIFPCRICWATDEGGLH